MTLDLEEYRGDLAELGLSRAQEDELLRTLWQIMAAFVDLGWGVGSLQLSCPDLTQTFSENARIDVQMAADHTTQPTKAAALSPPLAKGDS